jgi:hypothetical protein
MSFSVALPSNTSSMKTEITFDVFDLFVGSISKDSPNFKCQRLLTHWSSFEQSMGGSKVASNGWTYHHLNDLLNDVKRSSLVLCSIGDL